MLWKTALSLVLSQCITPAFTAPLKRRPVSLASDDAQGLTVQGVSADFDVANLDDSLSLVDVSNKAEAWTAVKAAYDVMTLGTKGGTCADDARLVMKPGECRKYAMYYSLHGQDEDGGPAVPKDVTVKTVVLIVPDDEKRAYPSGCSIAPGSNGGNRFVYAGNTDTTITRAETTPVCHQVNQPVHDYFATSSCAAKVAKCADERVAFWCQLTCVPSPSAPPSLPPALPPSSPPKSPPPSLPSTPDIAEGLLPIPRSAASACRITAVDAPPDDYGRTMVVNMGLSTLDWQWDRITRPGSTVNRQLWFVEPLDDGTYFRIRIQARPFLFFCIEPRAYASRDGTQHFKLRPENCHDEDTQKFYLIKPPGDQGLGNMDGSSNAAMIAAKLGKLLGDTKVLSAAVYLDRPTTTLRLDTPNNGTTTTGPKRHQMFYFMPAPSPPTSPPPSPPSTPPSPPPPPSPPSTPDIAEVLPTSESAARQISSHHGSKVWDDGHGRIYMGGSHDRANQKFFIEPLDGGTYFKMRIKSDPSKCLDYDPGNSKLYMGGCHGGNNQKFYLQSAGVGDSTMDGDSNAAYISTKDYDDSNRVLDYDPGNGNLYFGTKHGGANQKFYFI